MSELDSLEGPWSGVVYHGTTHEFDEFDLSNEGKRATVGGGVFFTSSYDVAREVYAWESASRIITAEVSLSKPLGYAQYFELAGLDRSAETSGGRDAPVNYYDDNWDVIVAFAKKHGFDGIVWPADPDSEMPHDLIVVFDPACIEILSVDHIADEDADCDSAPKMARQSI